MSDVSPGEPNVRAAEESDVDACVQLALAAAPGGGGSSDPEVWRGALGRDVQDPDRQLVVAVAEDRIVGYARAHLVEAADGAAVDAAPPGYYLIGLWVDPGHRHGGLGASLTAARLRWISERAGEAWFFTEATNAASIALHERFGFVEVTRRFSFRGVPFEDGARILFRTVLRGG